MKRLLTSLLVPAAAAALAVPAGAERAPTLRMVNFTPLVVRGTAFVPREVVTVTAPTGRIQVRTTATGSFVASFRGTPRCSSGGVVVAVGARGERVLLRLPLTMCAPAMSH